MSHRLCLSTAVYLLIHQLLAYSSYKKGQIGHKVLIIFLVYEMGKKKKKKGQSNAISVFIITFITIKASVLA